MKTPRTRGPNFNTEEQKLLVKTTEGFYSIIECKKSDCIKHVQKQEAWAKITEIYNANTKFVPRTTENLISCYRNLKTKLKKDSSKEETKPFDVLASHSDSSTSDPDISMKNTNPTLISHDQVTTEPNILGIQGVDVLRKKNDPELIIIHDNKRVPEKDANPTNISLAEDKMQLVHLQKLAATEQIRESKLKCELLELDITHKKQKHKLELEDLLRENSFKEEMRKKQLELLDVQIYKIKK